MLLSTHRRRNKPLQCLKHRGNATQLLNMVKKRNQEIVELVSDEMSEVAQKQDKLQELNLQEPCFTLNDNKLTVY